MLLKYCIQYCGTFRKLSSGHRTRKGHFSLQYQRNTKEWTNYHTVEHFSHASQVMLKILQAGLQQYMNQKFPYVPAGFSRGRDIVVLAAQWGLTFWDPMDWSPPGYPIHEILQARILVWVAIPFSRGPSRPRDWTLVSCIASRFFTIWATRKPL